MSLVNSSMSRVLNNFMVSSIAKLEEERASSLGSSASKREAKDAYERQSDGDFRTNVRKIVNFRMGTHRKARGRGNSSGH